MDARPDAGFGMSSRQGGNKESPRSTIRETPESGPALSALSYSSGAFCQVCLATGFRDDCRTINQSFLSMQHVPYRTHRGHADSGPQPRKARSPRTLVPCSLEDGDKGRRIEKSGRGKRLALCRYSGLSVFEKGRRPGRPS